MQNGVINVNGQIFPVAEAETQLKARVSVFDRSYLYGDSLYEVCRTYGGKLFLAPEHLERLARSAELCRMTLSQPLSHYLEQMEQTLRHFHRLNPSAAAPIEAYVRLIVSRGEGKIGFGLGCLKTPTLYTVIVQALEPPTAAQFEKGFSFAVSRRLRNDPRALDPAMKSGNYLNSLLAYLDAAEEGYDDALLCNHEGHVTEGTTFNIAYVRRGIIATPPLDIGILDGLTRRKMLKLAGELGIEAREVRFPRERLYEADEVFMLSTIKEVFPVTSVDGRKIAGGKPGPVTRRLHRAFRESVGQA